MEMFSRGNLDTTQDIWAHIGIKMGIFTKAHGRTMSSKDLESLSQQTDNNTKVALQRDINMVKVYINGPMEINIKDIFSRIKDKDQGYIYGPTEGCTRGNGKLIE